MNPEKVFSEIYTNGLWSTNPWNSGPGSDPGGEARDYCLVIPAVLKSMGARRVVDLGCGDGRVMSTIAEQCPEIEFTGIDCCEEVIKSCMATWPGLRWHHNDIIDAKSLPRNADVYLAKDVFHHWPTSKISNLLHWFDNYSLSLIATQDSEQAKDNDYSDGCSMGGYRPLSEKSFPFSSYDPVVLSRYLHKTILLFQFA